MVGLGIRVSVIGSLNSPKSVGEFLSTQDTCQVLPMVPVAGISAFKICQTLRERRNSEIDEAVGFSSCEFIRVVQ